MRLFYSCKILAEFYRSTLDDRQYYQRFGRLPKSRRFTIICNILRQNWQLKIPRLMANACEQNFNPEENILR